MPIVSGYSPEEDAMNCYCPTASPRLQLASVPGRYTGSRQIGHRLPGQLQAQWRNGADSGSLGNRVAYRCGGSTGFAGT